jgi:plasmid stabilization system protein ParE
MKRYVLTPSATKDVNDIWDYIANDSIEAADRVLRS